MGHDDGQLGRAFRDGDEAAFEQVYRAHAGRVLAYALQLCPTRSDAEDLAQEAFVAAYRSRRSFRGAASIATWLLAIVRRRWRDQGRAGRPTCVAPLDDGRQAGPCGRSPADRAVSAMALRDAVARLEPAIGEPFHLVMVQGLTHREAAELLGRPVGTVKWCVATAARRLREALADD